MNAATEVQVRIRVDSFAPPLSDSLMADYFELCKANAVLRLLWAVVRRWRDLPMSQECGYLHPNGRCQVVPLSQFQEQQLSGLMPSCANLVVIQRLCDSLRGKQRDAAFHLLWHVKELAAGREPITQDKLVNL